jgi:hypothetical protein
LADWESPEAGEKLETEELGTVPNGMKISDKSPVEKGLAHVVSGAIEQGVFLGPAFDRPRLQTVGPVRHRIVGYPLQEESQECSRAVAAFEALEIGHQGVEPVHGPCQAHSMQGKTGLGGGLPHQGTNQVIGQRVHPDLFANDVGRLAPQPLHSHRRFDVPESQFDHPAISVQGRDLDGGESLRVQQRRGHRDRAAAELGDRHGKTNQPNRQRLGQGVPLEAIHLARPGMPGGAPPGHSPIVLAQSPAPAEVLPPPLVQAKDRVAGVTKDPNQVVEAAIEAVGQHDLSRRQRRPQRAPQVQF